MGFSLPVHAHATRLKLIAQQLVCARGCAAQLLNLTDVAPKAAKQACAAAPHHCHRRSRRLDAVVVMLKLAGGTSVSTKLPALTYNALSPSRSKRSDAAGMWQAPFHDAGWVAEFFNMLHVQAWLEEEAAESQVRLAKWHIRICLRTRNDHLQKDWLMRLNEHWLRRE